MATPATGDRTHEGFFVVRNGIEAGIARALAYAPHADVLWCETSTPDLGEARAFAEAVLARYPEKLLANNCSPSFNRKKHLDDHTIARFQRELGAMGYRFQFITLAGFRVLNASMFELARWYAAEGMTAYVRLQELELQTEPLGYTAARHQAEVGTGYFDRVSEIVSGRLASTLALRGSTEEAQFGDDPPDANPAGQTPRPPRPGRSRLRSTDEHLRTARHGRSGSMRPCSREPSRPP